MMKKIGIVGGGLAGVSIAWGLAQKADLVLFDAGEAGASELPAGMVNPFMGRLARPIWRMEAIWDAFHAFLHRTGTASLFKPSGLLRPVQYPRQKEYFQHMVARFSHRLSWWSAEEVAERFPTVVAPDGALWVKDAGILPMRTWVHAMRSLIRKTGHEVYERMRIVDWQETNTGVRVQAATGEIFQVSHLIVAPGAGFVHLPALRKLKLHRIKGQMVEIVPPEGTIPPLGGSGYVLPLDGQTFLGSSYEHTFTDLRPSPDKAREILEKIARMWPDVHTAAIRATYVGVRVTVPGTRLPMVGPLPGHRRVWIATGLGTRGILMSLWLGTHLYDWLQAGRPPYAELHPRET